MPRWLPWIERFWSNVQIDFSTGCWVWTGGLRDGYGRMRVEGSRSSWVSAHRYVYENYVGEVPEGKELDHLCRNRPCVKPGHLEVVTGEVNVWRARGLAGPGQRFSARWIEVAQAPSRGQVSETCRRGHAKEGSNVYQYRGYRRCRVCLREQWRARSKRLAVQ